MKYTDIKKQRGFTLIEIAIVLVIIGILLSIGTGMIGTLTKRAKLSEAREIINAALESVISYGAANNKLPDTTVFPTVIRNPNDAWTKPLYYIYDNNLTDVTIGGICGRKTTNLTVRICPDATCSTPTNTISNAAFIVLSGNGNYNNQTAGNQEVTSATTINVYGVDVPNIDNYAGDIGGARPEPYDDIVKWITIDELRIKAGCTGSQLKIVNNELPYGFQNSTYSAVVSADGGAPFSAGGKYRWCRQESATTGLTFSPSTLSANCLTLAEASWGQATDLTISGTPTVFGNFNITFFVRDNNDSSGTNDNITQKAFVLTISPPSWVIVRNSTSSAVCYRVNGVLPCKTLNINDSFSAGFTETITFFTNSSRCGNNDVSCSHNYATLKAYDTDTDGQVKLNAITYSPSSCTILDD